MSNAISRSKVKIWISPVDTNASTLLNSGTTNLAPILGEIKSYSKSGGERDVESDPHFGGYVDKEKPVSQVEVSFEITPSLDDPTRWDELAYAVDTDNAGVYTMAAAPSDRTVFIQATDGTAFKAWGFNNCNVTVLDMEQNADDNQTNNLVLKFSPINDSGVSNFMSKGAAATTMPDWDNLAN